MTTQSSLIIERTTVHISDDTGRIAMLEERTLGTDPSPAELTRYIYSNHLQSASLELDEDAEIISYEEYHPYGTMSYQAMNATINAVAKRYRYTGKERDEESGLYYHGARYYIPWLCRWTAVDPLEAEYTPWSPYHYVKCNPINDTDSTGMGGDKDRPLEKNAQWEVGVIHYDFAEYKGFEPPDRSSSRAGEIFQVGVYDVLPYYMEGQGPEDGGKPIFYTASQRLEIGEHFDERGYRIIDRDYTRIDFLIMPWGLDNFKKDPKLWGISADQNHFRFGSLPLRYIPLTNLQLMDENYLGALATEWKSALKNPLFWFQLGAGVASLRAPAKVDLMGGQKSRNKGFINYDRNAVAGIADDVSNFSKHFKPNSVSEVIVNNPQATFLTEIQSSLKSGATVTIRGTMSNPYFNSIWNNKASGLGQYKIIKTTQNVPNAGYKQTGGKPIQGKINEIILQRK